MREKDTERFINDIVLVNACLAGKASANEYLYDKYSSAMFGICRRMMSNKQDAEDVFQDSFISVFSKLKTYNGKSPLKYWMKRIFINNCINHLKKRREIYDLEYIEPAVEEITDDDNIEYDIESVKKAMSYLADGYRTVLNLYLFEGYNHKEIAKILNISESTSKSQYKRAKIKLKNFLISARKQTILKNE